MNETAKRNVAAEAREEKAENHGICEGCGGPLNEHGLSPYNAEAEQLEPVERDDTTDQYAHAEATNEMAFVDAIKKKRGA